MKKRLWSPEEDAKLIAFVNQHGAKRWNDIPLHAGLQRSARSCRLRWANYLRPGMKRGKFSAQEIKLVFELQAFYGNRWSQIARWVLGRSDNEIKNFWSNVVQRSAKKRQKRPLCLDQPTSYRLAVPFKIEFDLPNLEDASENEAPFEAQESVPLESISCDFIFESFLDADTLCCCSASPLLIGYK